MPEKEKKFKNVKCWKPHQPRQDEFFRPLLMSIEMSRPKKSCCCSKDAPFPSASYPCAGCRALTGKFARHPAFQNNLLCGGSTGCGSCATGNAATCADQGPCGNSGGYYGGPCPPPGGGCNGGNGGGGNGCGMSCGGFGGGSCGGGGGGGCGGGGGGCGGNGGGRGNGCRCPRLPGQGPCDPPCFSTMVFPRFVPFVPEPKCNPLPILSPVCVDGCSMAPVGGTSMYGAFTRSCFSCNNCAKNGNVDVCALPCVGCNNAPCIPNGGYG